VSAAPIRAWLTEPLAPDVEAALARLAASPDVQQIAIMPDVHLAHDVCIGTVLATRRLVYPEAVGGDIGCGVAALRLHATADVLDDERAAAQVLGGLYRVVPALHHPVAQAPPLPPALEERPLSHPTLERLKAREARTELGTLGRGNHFVELQRDDEGGLWLMLHSGSRAIGQAIRDHHLRAATATATGLRSLDAETPAGRAYLADLDWALAWADENRRVMARAVAALLADTLGIAADEASFVSCHHNHVRREVCGSDAYWVHRKGAIPAADGEPGLIPGSMGAPSFHVTGRGHAPALSSSSHGAGRALSRGEAHRTISTRDLTRQLEGIWFDHRRAPQLRDEAPLAYKDIHAVLRAQRDLTRITRTLHPRLSYKAP
jgi:tRNA-splicing ligase RtcB